jgi:hypothetical protein
MQPSDHLCMICEELIPEDMTNNGHSVVHFYNKSIAIGTTLKCQVKMRTYYMTIEVVGSKVISCILANVSYHQNNRSHT